MRDEGQGGSQGWHATTILMVRKDGRVVIGGDGQVSLGPTIIKGNARKVRRLGKNADVIAGFAGATADAFTLFERLEALVLTGTGDVLEPEATEHGAAMAIGSGGNYALSAARALLPMGLDAEETVRRSMAIAADICVYTNRSLVIEAIDLR